MTLSTYFPTERDFRKALIAAIYGAKAETDRAWLDKLELKFIRDGMDAPCTEADAQRLRNLGAPSA